MLKTVVFVVILTSANGGLIPLVYSSTSSAVSHQSRLDITHNPSFISPSPVLYNLSPYYSQTARVILTPVFSPDSNFVPGVYHIFHNGPLTKLETDTNPTVNQNDYGKPNEDKKVL